MPDQDGLRMPVHQPNQGGIRARSFELEEVADTVRIREKSPWIERRRTR